MGGARARSWAWPWELRRRGVLGLNARNLYYLLALNPRRSYRLVDDKVLTKDLCVSRGIAVPQTYAVIERYGDVKRLDRILGEREEFVVKPAGGAGGRGVLVVIGRRGGAFLTGKDRTISAAELRYHVATTLSGLHSLGGQSDRVIIEQRIVPHPVFADLTIDGTPDVRVIMYRRCPAAAMLRLPTRASRGRANLHQGAVGVGIHLDSGRTFGGVCRNRAVADHPDTGQPLAGLPIPYWSDILQAAQGLSAAIPMGYIGVDIVLDVTQGPIVLEANARPGLAVQVANRTGLATALAEIGQHRSA